MIGFLRPFLIFIVMYHILVTVIWYGALWWAYPQLPALGRDGIRVVFFALVLIYNAKALKTYLKTWKWPWITLIMLLMFGVEISLFKGKAIYDIFVGVKYGLMYLFIFLSATLIGWIFTEHTTNRFLKFLKYTLIITVIAGFIRQGLKCIRPDLFMSIGYGPLNDFKFGVKPPIYYLTWYQGALRRQGIFSWPNNYGYFLIAFLPAVILFLKQKSESIKQFIIGNKQGILNTSILILRIVAIVLTLSRTAYIGWIVWLALINIQRIKTHKKISRGIGILAIAGIVGLSILKWASTLGHIQAKFGSIKYVIQEPSGYGLGTSWPAVNHNGTILPENYYIQLMLDIGTLGFLIWTVLILQITGIIKRIQQSFKNMHANSNEQTIYNIRRWLNIGRISLLIMGMFLHVFEDSMINYIFFVSWWILSGYLSTIINKQLPKNSEK